MAAVLHQSVRERYAYVSERIAKEEALAQEFDVDLRPFNVLREEDRARLHWEDASLLGPKRRMETLDEEEEAMNKTAVEGSVAMREIREIVARGKKGGSLGDGGCRTETQDEQQDVNGV